MKSHSVRRRLERLDCLCTWCGRLSIAWGIATMALTIGFCIASALSSTERGAGFTFDFELGRLIEPFDRWWMRAIGVAWIVTALGPIGSLPLVFLANRAVPRRPSLGYVEVSGRFVPGDRTRESISAARRREWKRRETIARGADGYGETEECLVCEGLIGASEPAYRSRGDVLCESCRDAWIAPEAPELP